ncbi:hypothetical protein HDU77_000470, partial [Chytriomyces hyalinus]
MSTPPKPSVDKELAKVMEGLKIFTTEVICGTSEHPTSKPSECPQFQQDICNGWKAKTMKSRDSLKEFFHLYYAENTFVKLMIENGRCQKRILDTFKQQAGVSASSNDIT